MEDKVAVGRCCSRNVLSGGSPVRHALNLRFRAAVIACACIAVGGSPPVWADLWKDLARDAVHGAVRGAVDEVRSRVGGSRRYGHQDGEGSSSDYNSSSDSSSYSTRVAPTQPEHHSPAPAQPSYYDTPSGGSRSWSSDSASSAVRVGGYQNLQLNKPKISPFDQRAQQSSSWQSTPGPRAYESHPKPDDRPTETSYRYSTARRVVPITRSKTSSSDLKSDVKSEHLVLPGFPGGGLIVKED